MNQLLLLLWLNQESREARILQCSAGQDWETRTEPVPVSVGGSSLISLSVHSVVAGRCPTSITQAFVTSALFPLPSI
jgi:hypothetical protein